MQSDAAIQIAQQQSKENINTMATLASLAAIIAGGLIALMLAAVTMFSGNTPGIDFFAAFSASITMLYVAGLSDVHRLRDGVFLLVATLSIGGPLVYDHSDAMLVCATFFSHLLIAFVNVVTRATNTLTDLNLWPFLFGLELVVLAMFIHSIP